MRKYVSKKKLRKYINRLENAIRNADIRATSASAIAILTEKENIQLKRKIKGLDNQLNIKRSIDKAMDEFDKSLKHYEPEPTSKTTSNSRDIRWTTNPRNFDQPFPNWEN